MPVDTVTRVFATQSAEANTLQAGLCNIMQTSNMARAECCWPQHVEQQLLYEDQKLLHTLSAQSILSCTT